MIARLVLAYTGKRIDRTQVPEGGAVQQVDPLTHDLWQNAGPLMKVLISARAEGVWQTEDQSTAFLEDVDELQHRYFGHPLVLRSENTAVDTNKIEAGGWRVKIGRMKTLYGHKFGIDMFDTGGQIMLMESLPGTIRQGLEGRPVSDLADLKARFPSISQMLFMNTDVDSSSKGSRLPIVWPHENLTIPTASHTQIRRAVITGQWLRWSHRITVWWPSLWAPILLLLAGLAYSMTMQNHDAGILKALNTLALGMVSFSVGTLIFDWVYMKGHGGKHKTYQITHTQRSIKEAYREIHRST